MNLRDKPLRDLALFPAIYDAIGMVVIGAFYASSPGFSVDWNALNFVFHSLVFATRWFLARAIAGTYNFNERNLPVLMITHVVVDVITFGLGIFA